MYARSMYVRRGHRHGGEEGFPATDLHQSRLYVRAKSHPLISGGPTAFRYGKWENSRVDVKGQLAELTQDYASGTVVSASKKEKTLHLLNLNPAGPTTCLAP